MGMYIGSEFINSQPNSHVSSPVLDHQQSMAPMQQPAVPPPAQRSSPSQIIASIPVSNSPSTHRSTLRDHPATFPQLSSFSISQSNVRSESTSGIKARIAAPQASQAALPKRTSSPRFILPVNRVSSGYKPSPPTMASRPPQSAPTSAAPPRFVSQQPEPPSLHTPPVIQLGAYFAIAGQQRDHAAAGHLASATIAGPAAGSCYSHCVHLNILCTFSFPLITSKTAASGVSRVEETGSGPAPRCRVTQVAFAEPSRPCRLLSIFQRKNEIYWGMCAEGEGVLG
ncbi:hypothetical protein DL89DRAFT_15395 [Linderina pennispora]|uniref:Uncharacterized protein n=1 Tax=Linderina pennispora TaxID=61395 RepID=A0A1Y1WLF3_9FUNG|nr:uncharacterized protein DL89DRAFT_15395 [Linderina pennispora]ORX74399.1 hypothetical protein DL89DRAFT_15395 [Linderina pennispora]